MRRAMAADFHDAPFVAFEFLGFRSPHCLIHCFLSPARLWQELWWAAQSFSQTAKCNLVDRIKKSLGIALLPSQTSQLWLVIVLSPSQSHFPSASPRWTACKVTCWLAEFYDLNAIYGANSLWQWQPEQVDGGARQSNGPGLGLRSSAVELVSGCLINHSILFSIIWFRAHLS